MSRRAEFLKHVRAKLGAVVCWAHKGPDAYDCSGVVTASILEAGGEDLKATHNANRMFSLFPPSALPEPGDLGFFSELPGESIVTHVVIVDEVDPSGDVMGRFAVISGDGAMQAIGLELAKASEHCRVRRYDSVVKMGRKYFRGFRKNIAVEE